MTFVPLTLKAYPKVVELILRFSHKRVAPNSPFPRYEYIGEVDYGNELHYQSPGRYHLSVILGANYVEFDTIGDYPLNDQMISDIQGNVREDQLELSNLLLDNIKILYPDKEARYSYIRDSFSEVFESFLSKFELRDRIRSEATPGDGELVRYSLDIDGKKTYFTAYSTGTITTQGYNTNGYQEEFWQLLIDMRDEKK